MYGQKIVDPNDIRWNDASYYIMRLDALENSIMSILKDYNSDNLKMLLSLLDAYIIMTFAVVKYDKSKYEEQINEIEKQYYQLDANKDGKVDDFEEMRSRQIILKGMKVLREIYIDIKCIVTPFLSIDIKKQLKEMRSLALYKAMDKWVDKNILHGYDVYCPRCRQRFIKKDEQKIEDKGVHELDDGYPGQPA